jgi:hypothetical protein
MGPDRKEEGKNMSIKIAVKEDAQKDVVLTAKQLTIGKLYRALQYNGKPYNVLTTLYTRTESCNIVWFEDNRCGTFATENDERNYILAPEGAEVVLNNLPR